MPKPTLVLLVLKTHEVEFREEKHGRGPTHFAGHLGDVVFEIYPLAEGQAADSSARLGFVIDDLPEVLQRLAIGNHCDQGEVAKTAPRGHRVLRDPDGRAVELHPAPTQ